ncbi:hypothetical protein ABIB25_004281, partial [Nakamurella sp. UYEF19]|uniref:hypothetical protein n=1 Tax=Nakamurella sp. UYEF19 TaxID=1756392 RepID=UPI0033934D99
GLALDVYEPSSQVTLSSLQPQLSKFAQNFAGGVVTQVSGVADKAEFAFPVLAVAAGNYVFEVWNAGEIGDSAGAVAIAKKIAAELASK